MGNTVIGGGFFTSKGFETDPSLLEHVADVVQELGLGEGEKIIFDFREATEHPDRVAEAAQNGTLVSHSANNIIPPTIADIAEVRQSTGRDYRPDVVVSASGPGGQTGSLFWREAKLGVGGIQEKFDISDAVLRAPIGALTGMLRGTLPRNLLGMALII
ncbi:MAG TPA: hypothetical protein VLH38_01265 [Patescibacteria group bacterium]|nr:hypothetical protein [Patescibacteria group bacterium]